MKPFIFWQPVNIYVEPRMSLADDLRAAEKRLKKLNEEEKTRKTTKKSAGGTGTRARVADWTWDNEIIALFLYRSKASKFIRENYSKKRKISPRAMTMRMAIFESLCKGKPVRNLGEQTQKVFDEYAVIEIKELQNVVVSILRGEFSRDQEV